MKIGSDALIISAVAITAVFHAEVYSLLSDNAVLVYFLTCYGLALVLGVATFGTKFPLLWFMLLVVITLLAFGGVGAVTIISGWME